MGCIGREGCVNSNRHPRLSILVWLELQRKQYFPFFHRLAGYPFWLTQAVFSFFSQIGRLPLLVVSKKGYAGTITHTNPKSQARTNVAKHEEAIHAAGSQNGSDPVCNCTRCRQAELSRRGRLSRRYSCRTARSSRPGKPRRRLPEPTTWTRPIQRPRTTIPAPGAAAEDDQPGGALQPGERGSLQPGSTGNGFGLRRGVRDPRR